MSEKSQLKKLGRLLDKDYTAFLQALPQKFTGKITKCNHPYYAHRSKNYTRSTKLKKYPEVIDVTIHTDWCRLCGQKFHKNSSYHKIDRLFVIGKNYNYITGLTRWKK